MVASTGRAGLAGSIPHMFDPYVFALALGGTGLLAMAVMGSHGRASAGRGHAGPAAHHAGGHHASGHHAAGHHSALSRPRTAPRASESAPAID
jgi:hypothetical protein